MTPKRRVPRDRTLIPALGLAVLITASYFVFSALFGSRHGDLPNEDVANIPAVSVRVEQAQLRTLQPRVSVIGTVQPDPERLSMLTAATTGSVEKLVTREELGLQRRRGDPAR